MLEIITVAILMLVVAIVGKKPDGGYKNWAKFVMFFLVIWLVINFIYVGHQYREADKAWQEFQQSLDDINQH